MRKTIAALLLAMSLAACGDPAAKLLETAQFEEKQFNKQHAAELYRRILNEHPQSPQATLAKDRLAELEKTP